jgi:DNA polymerase III subunit epsilon
MMNSLKQQRQVVLDTETTGINPKEGHKIIEIGCVELINRRLTQNRFHVYLNPDREIDAGAIEVHGITNDFLEDKPRFADVVEDFMTFTHDAELIIHNAPFDVGFLNHELALLAKNPRTIESNSSVFDTLTFARKKTPWRTQ